MKYHFKTNLSQAQWLTPVIPALWEAKASGSPERSPHWLGTVAYTCNPNSSRGCELHGFKFTTKKVPLLNINSKSYLASRNRISCTTHDDVN
ncbi:hypothetical protein AAY473_004132 [Plecturocebus cupreus]